MKSRFLFVSLLFFCFSISSFGQTLPFSKNEKLTYSASYNMSGLLTSFAEVTMQTSEVKTDTRTLYKFKCTATTYSKWDSYFKIRDFFEAYVNPKTMQPVLYKRDTDEGGHKRYEKYTFNHKTKKVKTVYKKPRKEDRHDVIPLNSGTKDLVSTLYSIRTLPIDKAAKGDSKVFKILFDRKEKFVQLKFLGKETINSVLGKKACYKIAVSVTNEKLLKGTNQNIMWISADQHKIPLQIKFNIAVGNGVLKLKSATGLK